MSQSPWIIPGTEFARRHEGWGLSHREGRVSDMRSASKGPAKDVIRERVDPPASTKPPAETGVGDTKRVNERNDSIARPSEERYRMV